jgi:hypothetical protein
LPRQGERFSRAEPTARPLPHSGLPPRLASAGASAQPVPRWRRQARGRYGIRILEFLFFAILSQAAILVIGGFLLPDRVHVERATTIDRSPAPVFAILDSYRRINQWSPWAAKAPYAT